MGAGRLYRNSLYLMANTVAVALLGFVFWATAARLYPAESVGTGATLVTASLLLANAGLLGFNAAVIRYLPGASDPKRLVVCTLGCVIVATAVLAVVYVFIAPVLSPALTVLRGTPGYVFVVLAAGGAAFLYLDSVLVAVGSGGGVLIKNVLAGLAKLALVSPLAWLGGFGVFSAAVVPSVVLVWMSWRWLSPRFPHSLVGAAERRPVDLQPLLKYAAGSHIAHLAKASPPLLLPLLVTVALGAEAAAYVYVAIMVAGGLTLIPIATCQSLFAEASAAESTLRDLAIRSGRFIAILLGLGMPLTVLLAELLLSLFGPEYAAEATGLLRLLALTSVPVGFSAVAVTVLRVRKRVGVLAQIACAAAVAQLASAAALVGPLGLEGVGVAWLITEVTVAGLYWRAAYPLLRAGTRAAVDGPA